MYTLTSLRRRLTPLTRFVRLALCLLAAGGALPPRPASANGVGTVFVTHQGAGAVTILEHIGNSVLATLPVDGVPGDVAFTADGQLALVGSRDSGTLSIIDRDAYQVTGSVRAGGLAPAVAVPGGTTSWVAADGAGNRLVVMDAAGALLRAIPTAGKPLALAASPTAPWLYALIERSNELAVFDARSGAPGPAIPVGAPGASIALSPDGGTAFVTQPEAQSVAVVDLAAGREVVTIPLGEVPAGAALGPNGRLYVTVPRTGSVFVVDLASRSVAARVPVGRRPLGIGVATERGALAYVANNADDTVSVIDLATLTVTKTVPVSPGPSGVAVTRSHDALLAVSAAGGVGRLERAPIPRDFPNTGAGPA